MHIDWSPKAQTLLRHAGRDLTTGQFRFPLLPGPHLFTDWRYVLPADVWGGFRWVSKDTGETIPVRVVNEQGEFTADPIDARMEPDDVPFGIRIVAQRATKSDPLPADGPPGMHVLEDDGRYRTWFTRGNSRRFEGTVFCAESEDAFAWHDVQVCQFDWRACPDAEVTEPPAVFIDPTAADGERYKMVFLGRSTRPEYETYRRKLLTKWLAERPDDIDPAALTMTPGIDTPVIKYARYGAVSGDGVGWTVLPDPLMLLCSDAQNVLTYDAARGIYTWYLKSEWYGARRCIARAETRDFRRWPLPQTLLFPGAGLGPADDWYTNSKTIYPGTTDCHLMFPTLYHHDTDDSELRLFAGPDGAAWTEVPGGSVLDPGPVGSWDAGFFTAGVDLLPLGNNQVGLPIATTAYPHKYPRNRHTLQFRNMAYALWQRERLAALEAQEVGRFATVPFVLSGRRLRLNLRTKMAGEVRVEVTAAAQHGGAGKVLPGRSFEDCVPIVGDHLDKFVTWNSGEDIGHEEGQAVTLRFQVRAAKLFAFEVL